MILWYFFFSKLELLLKLIYFVLRNVYYEDKGFIFLLSGLMFILIGCVEVDLTYDLILNFLLATLLTRLHFNGFSSYKIIFLFIIYILKLIINFIFHWFVDFMNFCNSSYKTRTNELPILLHTLLKFPLKNPWIPSCLCIFLKQSFVPVNITSFYPLCIINLLLTVSNG